MKVVAFNRSARKNGNTTILIEKVFEELGKESIETELVHHAGRNNKGCPACFRCFKNKDCRCSVKDDSINECIEKMIDELKKYANEREQWGRPIGKPQMVQEELARMIVETEAARSMVYKCAVQKDARNLGNALETVIAKYYSCDVVSKVADGALRIVGV